MTVSLLQYVAQPAKVSKGGRVAQPDAVKKGIGKDLQLALGSLSRIEVIRRAFDAHQIGLQYEPGPQRGPPMKMWWTGRCVFKFPHPCQFLTSHCQAEG